ncbi:MAG TPA: hypothetical protein DD490_19940 [Acidobacteria bacterium]|nr:hypothetical protein [Acidobacteriota bacterium]
MPIKEVFTDQGDELSFASTDDLIRQLGGIDASVPRRTEGRRAHHRERYCVVRYLTALARSSAETLGGQVSLLKFPLKIKKWESPDFLLHLPDGAVAGIEITEAGTEHVQRAATQLEKSPPGSFMEDGEVRLPGEKLRGRPFAGNEPELELTRLILESLTNKTEALNRGHYAPADRYELLIYDNSHLPLIDLGVLAPLLKTKLTEWLRQNQTARAFDSISVLRDSELLYDCAGAGAVFEYGELPNLKLTRGVVAPEIIDAAHRASRKLFEAGIPHALAGGLAVCAHGYPRTTDDVDFLVGDEAFEKHGGGFVTLKLPLIAIGSVRIDFVSIDESKGELRQLRPAVEESPRSEGVPIVPLPALVYMKLKAGRQKDTADLVELLKRGEVDLEELDQYLAEYAPEQLRRWQRVKEIAAREE